MDIKEFTKYWNIMKRNYQDKTHTTDDLKYYYSILRNYTQQDLKNAFEKVLKFQSYFPRIDEIVKYLPGNKEEDTPTWMSKPITDEISEKELEELEDIVKQLGG